MIRLTTIGIIAASLLFAGCSEQKTTLDQRFRQHIEFLASDDLQGREAGTEAEKKAAEYIAAQFEKIGLEPLGVEDSWYQDFDFLAGKNYGGTKQLMIGDKGLSIDEDYFPLNFSGNAAASGKLVMAGFGIQAEELSYDDYKDVEMEEGDIVVLSVSSPDGIHPHSKYAAYHDLRNRAITAKDLGASAVIYINNDETANDPRKSYNQNVTEVGIPVVFVQDAAEITEGAASIEVELLEDRKDARNVIGWINNGADKSVVMGAHYDHLGYGKSGGSLYRGEEELVHNGADDNASGVAMIIELARELKEKGSDDYNYIFMAFSGEEKGLLGSNYFTKNSTYELTTTSYMWNFDMVGRLDTAKNSISVLGTGTSPVWDSLLTNTPWEGIDIVQSKSGTGPSDFTSFYLSDIPTLGFFTGTHEDYHKPSDDSDLINYEGMEDLFSYVLKLQAKMSGQEKLAFTQTADDQARSAPRFTVTLGVVPDYMYEEKGLRLDGVTEGKPASASGLAKGDIITRIGEYEIHDIYAYMGALGQFKKGDEAEVEFDRDGEKKTVMVKF